MWNLVAMETAEHSKCLPLIDCYIVAVFSHLEGVNERIGVSERHMCLVCVCVCVEASLGMLCHLYIVMTAAMIMFAHLNILYQ